MNGMGFCVDKHRQKQMNSENFTLTPLHNPVFF